MLRTRGRDEAVLTRIVNEGSIALDPPGLELALTAIFGAERKARSVGWPSIPGLRRETRASIRATGWLRAKALSGRREAAE